jgi:soluble lytic murein transglycosylase-like protein
VRVLNVFLFLLALAPAALPADPPQTGNPGQPAVSTVPQNQGVAVAAAMAASLAAQRASIARQLGQTPSQSFFVLPPPKSGIQTLRAPSYDCDPLPASTLDPLISDAAMHEGLEPELLRGLIRQESGFRPCAVSPKGAIGLTQLMPATAADLGVKDPFDPKQSVDGGAKFLKQLLNMFDNLPMALGAYNAGPGRVAESGGVPNIPETQDYVRRILSGFTGLR